LEPDSHQLGRSKNLDMRVGARNCGEKGGDLKKKKRSNSLLKIQQRKIVALM